MEEPTQTEEDPHTEFLTREFGNKNCLHFHFSYTYEPEYVVSVANTLNEEFLTLSLEYFDWGHAPVHNFLEMPGIVYVDHPVSLLLQFKEIYTVKVGMVVKEFIKAAFKMAHFDACVYLTNEFGFDFDDEQVTELWNDMIFNRIEDYQVTPNEFFFLLVELCLARNHPVVNPSSGLLILATRELLEFGADPRVKNEAGETPLILAAKTGYYSVLKLIIDRLETEDVNVRDNQSMTALLLLCSKLSRDPSLLSFLQDLREKNADFMIVDAKGHNCLHILFTEQFWCKNNALFITKRLGEKLFEMMLATDFSGKTRSNVILLRR